MKRLILVCIAWLSLAACSSTPSNLNYYLLDSGMGSGTIMDTPHGVAEDRPLVLLSEVTLTEFLRQSNLLVQLEDHEMHYAMNHIWAEPLRDAIPNVVLKDLRVASSDYYFERGGSEWFGKEAYRINIQIDQFHPNAQQQVVLSGRYWIRNIETDTTVARDFALTETLTQDGYGHAVVKMRRVMSVLSDHILRHISS